MAHGRATRLRSFRPSSMSALYGLSGWALPIIVRHELGARGRRSARAGGEVTVIREAGPALERWLAYPWSIEGLVKKGWVVGDTATPFVLAGLGLPSRE